MEYLGKISKMEHLRKVKPIYILCFIFFLFNLKLFKNYSQKQEIVNFKENNILSDDNYNQVINKSNPIHYDNRSQHYTWIGDHWIPAYPIPTYSPLQMLQTFEKINVLFIGDSTMRRAYATMFAVMTSSDSKNVRVVDVNDPKVIDVNKGRRYGEEICADEKRKLFNSTFFYESLCRDLGGVGQGEEEEGNVKESLSFGRFDYTKMVCYSHLIDYLQSYTGSHKDPATLMKTPNILALFEDYDVIVIGMGIWEAIRRRDCILRQINETDIVDANVRLNMTLHALKAISSPKLKVVIRTTGFHAGGNNDNIILSMNELTREFFNGLHDENNMTYLDWGHVIMPRSFDADRIYGDIPAHYGLEARLLFANMITHEMNTE